MLNQAFYRITASHFNDTRQQPWPGWFELLPDVSTPLTVLDLGCGNGRFGCFVADQLGSDITYTGIDSDATLLQYAQTNLSATDVQFTLQHSDLFANPLPQRQYDLVVLFGMVHHIPGNLHRQAFLKEVAACVRQNGLLVYACWQFLDLDRLKQRIAPWPDEWQREQNDYLLDWQRGTAALRYCHYVDDDENRDLIRATGLIRQRTFRADGRNGQLNLYTILRR